MQLPSPAWAAGLGALVLRGASGRQEDRLCGAYPPTESVLSARSREPGGFLTAHVRSAGLHAWLQGLAPGCSVDRSPAMAKPHNQGCCPQAPRPLRCTQGKQLGLPLVIQWAGTAGGCDTRPSLTLHRAWVPSHPCPEPSKCIFTEHDL